MPTTMEGTPESTSAVKRIASPSRVSPRSARYTPAPTPSGTPMRQAIPTMYKVPAMPFPTPPPVSPTGAGMAVKKLQSSPAIPREITSQSSETSGTSATPSASAQSPVINQLTARRVRIDLMPRPWTARGATRAPAAARRH
jgi:hypothetical protein